MSKRVCSHCEQDLSKRKYIQTKDGNSFCCAGCKRVYYLLLPDEKPKKTKPEPCT